MPENQELETPFEYNIYALILRKKGAVKYFLDNLAPEMVGLPSNNTGLYELYLAFLQFYDQTGLDPVDPIAFKEWLVQESKFAETLGGPIVLTQYLEIFQSIPLSTPEAVVTYLKHRANKRQQMQSLQELQLLLTKKEIKNRDDKKRLTKLTEQIRTLESEIGYNPLEKITTTQDILAHIDNLWELPNFLTTPYAELNKCLAYNENGGLLRGAVYAIIARSGGGKSVLSRCLCNHFVDQGLRVLYINYEEPKEHWERILISQVTKTNVYAGVPESNQQYLKEIFAKKMQEWGDRYMVRHDPDTSYFDDLEVWLRDILGHGEKIPDVLVIDTIQSMQAKIRGGPRWGEYEQMMIHLEKLAKDMNCAIIITCQENSNRLKDKREVVEQSDAGGSLTIIQKATASIFIVPKKVADEDESVDSSIVQLQIPKNRITGMSFFNNPPTLKYNDNTKSFEEFDIPESGSYFNIEEVKI